LSDIAIRAVVVVNAHGHVLISHFLEESPARAEQGKWIER
jgi:hypothetical protein